MAKLKCTAQRTRNTVKGMKDMDEDTVANVLPDLIEGMTAELKIPGMPEGKVGAVASLLSRLEDINRLEEIPSHLRSRIALQ